MSLPIQFRLRPWMMHPIARRVLMVANWCLAIAPLTLLITAVGASTQATKILGTVPKPFINDPYLFGQDDPVYQAWLHGAGLSMGATVLSIIPWCVLTAVTIFAHWRYSIGPRPMPGR